MKETPVLSFSAFLNAVVRIMLCRGAHAKPNHAIHHYSKVHKTKFQAMVFACIGVLITPVYAQSVIALNGVDQVLIAPLDSPTPFDNGLDIHRYFVVWQAPAVIQAGVVFGAESSASAGGNGVYITVSNIGGNYMLAAAAVNNGVIDGHETIASPSPVMPNQTYRILFQYNSDADRQYWRVDSSSNSGPSVFSSMSVGNVDQIIVGGRTVNGIHQDFQAGVFSELAYWSPTTAFDTSGRSDILENGNAPGNTPPGIPTQYWPLASDYNPTFGSAVVIGPSIANQPPTITSTPILSAQEGVAYSYDIDATDPEGQVITYSLVAGPPDIIIDTQTGVLSWTPSYTDAGDHPVSVTIEDSAGGTVSHDFTITVSDNNGLPVVQSSAITSVVEATAYSYPVVVSDPDGDALSYQLQQAPSGMLIDTNGVITWLPAIGQLGNFPVTVTIDDGTATIQHTYTLTVMLNDDRDGDGVLNQNDDCPLDPVAAVGNHDGDALCDVSDLDDDNDGVPDLVDLCPLDAGGALNNTDGDQWCNETDLDDDNDGVNDSSDAFALDASEWLDTDGDGVGNNTDPDDDNDGLSDQYENSYAHLNALDGSDAQLDSDNDGATNLEEFQAGSDPSDSNSSPELIIHTFSSSSGTINQAGREVTLSWTSWNATDIRLSNDVTSTVTTGLAENGSFVVTPQQTTRYTLTAIRGAEQVNKNLTITLNTAVPDSRWSSNLSLDDDQFISTSITVADDGSTYVGSFDGSLYKMNANGDVDWVLPDTGRVMGKVVINNNNIIFGGDSASSHIGTICSFNTDGTEDWVFSALSPVMASPVISQDGAVVYGVSFDGVIYALNSSDGSLRWSHMLDNAQVVAAPTLTPVGDTLIVRSATTAFAISITEAELLYMPQPEGVIVPDGSIPNQNGEFPPMLWRRVFSSP